ncbi:proton-coupled amino acid transporter-like protein CG1139 [Halyomorpha halys]|uniref:proton-coupled amino acid transporter-like protein CG1139 n=1 Tax=Halyomorpha halys TaxID=286706 RepID=UPI0006D52918|nr:proton-coupled amino acid transporter-like protein CG1139 [Halyomorpha halys]
MVFKKEVISNYFNDVENSKEDEKKEEQSDTPKNTYFDAIANNFRSTVGTAILALPKSFSQGGYIGAIIGIIFITFITNYCALILIASHRDLKKRHKDMKPTIQGTVEAAFAEGPESLRKFSPCILAATNFFLLVGQMGGVCVDLIFISTNIQAAAYPHLDMDVRYFELLVFIPAVLVSLIPNMKKMSIFSMIGNVALILSIGVVLYYVFKEPISFEERYPFGHVKYLPKFFGTIFYSTVTITLILPMENEMKRPGMLQGTFGVLNVTAIFCCVLYIFFGFFGYLKYGDNAKDTVTLNLPSNWVSTTVQILLSLAAFTSMAIMIYIGVNVIWNDYLDKRITKYRTFAMYMLRLSFITFTLIVSILVPDLQLVLSVLGIISQCTLSTTMPCIIHIITNRKQPSFWAYIQMFWLDAVTFMFTIVVLVLSFLSRF